MKMMWRYCLVHESGGRTYALEEWNPQNPRDFIVRIDVGVCPEEKTDVDEQFGLIVCTPRRMVEHLERNPPKKFANPPRYLLFVEYRYDDLVDALNQLFNREGDWDSMVSTAENYAIFKG